MSPGLGLTLVPREQVAAIERERDLERRNFTLRFQQIQEERDAMKREVEGLQEKVRLIHEEKEGCEEKLSELLEEQRCRSPPTAVGESLEEQRWAHLHLHWGVWCRVHWS